MVAIVIGLAHGDTHFFEFLFFVKILVHDLPQLHLLTEMLLLFQYLFIGQLL